MSSRKSCQLLHAVLAILTIIPFIKCTYIPNASAEKTEESLRESIKCHQEYNQDVSSANNQDEGSRQNFYQGEVTYLECNATGETWIINHRNSKAVFLIYPHSKRTCVTNDVGNGLWSGPLPICVNVKTDPDGAARQVKTDVKNCLEKNNGSGCTPINTWKKIGEFRGNCGSLEIPKNITSHEFLLSFRRSYYFSFLTFLGEDFLGVELFAEPKRIITNLSPESRTFLSTHFLYRQSAVNDIDHEKKCALTNMAVFTDLLRVRVLLPRENQHATNQSIKEKIKIYRILKCYETEAEEPTKCLKEPVIPHALKLRSNNNNSLEYKCVKGYAMIDPETNNPSDGVIQCIESDWTPYPYPACKPFKIVNSVQSDPSQTPIPLSPPNPTHANTAAVNMTDDPAEPPAAIPNYDSSFIWKISTGVLLLAVIIIGVVLVYRNCHQNRPEGREPNNRSNRNPQNAQNAIGEESLVLYSSDPDYRSADISSDTDQQHSSPHKKT